ncbi:MAG: hypothetical protein M1153_02850 [Patescibacteria group bacterium]|nr:hypothetical protein [Patescibacteria group bacterium]
MNKDVVTPEEISLIRSQVKATAEDMLDLSSKLEQAKNRLANAIDAYNRGRSRLLCRELENSGLTWCTWCRSVIPRKECRLFVVDGVELRLTGEGSGRRPFTRIQRLCPRCRKNTSSSPWQRFFEAEESGGCFYTLQGVKVDGVENLDDLAVPPPELLREFAVPCGIPEEAVLVRSAGASYLEIGGEKIIFPRP